MQSTRFHVSTFLASTLCALVAGCSGPAGDDDDGTGDDTGDDGGGPDGGVEPDAPPAPRTLSVCASGADYTRIGDAIAAASPGDTVEVCAGTFAERLVVENKQLTIVGAGAASTVIDAAGGGTGIVIAGTGGSGVTIEGFTIRNGVATTEGGGIRCEASTLHVIDSALVANNGPAAGGGLYATACTIEIEGTTFDANTGGRTGGGALLLESTGSVRGSVFIGNQAVNGAGLAISEGNVSVEGNEMRGNAAGLRGGGLSHASDGLVAGNTIVENTAGWTGGGIYVLAHAPLIRDNVIRGNSSPNDGGGIYVHQGTPTLRANAVSYNVSGDDGGGLRLFESGCVLEANIIENNEAGDAGGGARISHVPCMIIDNIVRNNTAGGTGGGYDLDNDASTMRGGEISGNHAGGSGGGIFTWLAPWNGTVIEDVVISNNRAWRGGGLFVDDNFTPVTLRRLTVVDNRAGLGGGMMVRATNFTLADSVFARNIAYDTGGGIRHAVASAWTDPCPPCPPLNPIGRIEFVVFYGNSAEDGGSAVWTNAAGLTVESSIAFANEGTSVMVEAAAETPGVFPAPTWRFNDTAPATFANMADPTGSSGNMSVDPLFVDAANGDFHLASGSACLDAGNPDMLDDDGSRSDIGLIGGSP